MNSKQISYDGYIYREDDPTNPVNVIQNAISCDLGINSNSIAYRKLGDNANEFYCSIKSVSKIDVDYIFVGYSIVGPFKVINDLALK